MARGSRINGKLADLFAADLVVSGRVSSLLYPHERLGDDLP